jgi:hypothetical protein
LDAHAQVFSLEGKLLWEKRVGVNAAANTYGDLFTVPDIDDLTPVYFLRLLLREGADNIVSRNFYWLSTAPAADFRDLAKLPIVRLKIAHTTESKGPEVITRVTLRNPTDQIAFFVHAAVMDGTTGEEVLPVRWDDNYFSLIPGESREVCARHLSEDWQGVSPVIDVGGWNVLSPFECSALRLSRTEVKVGEMFGVTAQINNTGLDGSVVQLLVDGKPLRSKRIWARGRRPREVSFQLWLNVVGNHSLEINGKNVVISVIG